MFLKKFYLLIALLAFLVKPIYNLSYLVYYQMNIDYITDAFCENKEKVERACKGKCHLAKQLKTNKAPSEDNSTVISIVDVLSLVFLENVPHFNVSKFTTIRIQKLITNRYIKYTFNFQSDHFKPPRFIA